MPCDRIVLGWAQRGGHHPAEVAVCTAGALDVLLVDAQRAKDARARLHWQVKCFDNGTEFLPIAPVAALSEGKAIAAAKGQESAIIRNLSRLRGSGQVTLGITWPDKEINDPNCASGRDWLRARTIAATEKKLKQEQAVAFLEQLRVGFRSKTRQTSRYVEQDVLVPKIKVQKFIEQIRVHASQFGATTLTLAVTGPWPPFSFVQPFSNTGKDLE